MPSFAFKKGFIQQALFTLGRWTQYLKPQDAYSVTPVNPLLWLMANGWVIMFYPAYW